MDSKDKPLQIHQKFLTHEDIEIKGSGGAVVAHYRNAFGESYVGPNIKNFYPTETLFGDWNGELLLLAQDALPAPSLSELILRHEKNGDPRESAWRHAEKGKGDKGGYKTNQKLSVLVDTYATGIGILYGSATANMLFDDGGRNFRQSLKGFNDPRLQKYLVEVLEWVVQKMPNIMYIMCLGSKAWDITSSASSLIIQEEFKSSRERNSFSEAIISGKNLKIIPAFHPMARSTKEDNEANWATLRALIGSS